MANESLSTISNFFEKQGKPVKFLHFFIVHFLLFWLGDFYDLELDCLFIFDDLIFWLDDKKFSFLLKIFFDYFSGVSKLWSRKFKPFFLDLWGKFLLLSLNFANYIFYENLVFLLHKVQKLLIFSGFLQNFWYPFILCQLHVGDSWIKPIKYLFRSIDSNPFCWRCWRKRILTALKWLDRRTLWAVGICKN